MSAYSDWQCGALSDDDFKSAMNRECADPEPDYCSGCIHHSSKLNKCWLGGKKACAWQDEMDEDAAYEFLEHLGLAFGGYEKLYEENYGFYSEAISVILHAYDKLLKKTNDAVKEKKGGHI